MFVSLVDWVVLLLCGGGFWLFGCRLGCGVVVFGYFLGLTTLRGGLVDMVSRFELRWVR